ncbi:2,3-bisphosphoglycerate-independent phosphoglycerate mutase-like isoform X1 [Panicum hallii]|nr:2,3-bisphosphoglycerate-independent phosphoglycerate mutase-like isoform X1 [Panicum hallii]
MMLLCSSKLDGLHNGLGRLLLEQSNLSWILFLAVWVFDACSHTKTAWSNTSTEAGPSWAYSGLLLSALQEFFIYPFPLPRSPLVLACVRGSVHPFLPCSEDWPSGAALRQVFVGPFAGYEYRQGASSPLAMGSTGFSWTLPDHPKLPKGKPVAVVVLDGWGEANPDEYNCIHVAQTPVMDLLKNGAPEKWRLVKAHGTAVGLPSDDDMGNSEVGHNALGAGRIFAQGAKLVDQALASGKIYEGDGFNYIKESFENATLHLIGLLSDGGVHSRLDQLQLLLKGASERGAKRIRVHILTDGRDVLDGSSVGFVETLENDLSQLREKGIDARIASGGGRMYVTMDRYENDWDVVKRGWDAQVLGEAPYKFKSALEAVKTLRAEPNANDQYLPPFVIVDDSGNAVGPVLDGDAVVTINFRADRMVMLAKALEYADFDKFDRVRVPKIRYAGMLQYDGELKLPSRYLVSPPEIERTSGEYLVKNGIRTFACSETVKFGHVTFFWNGNRSGYFDETKEEYEEIPSDSGITFNVAPKMKALEIAEKARDAILSGKFDQVRVNLPNGDMVGHTGDIKATVVACKAADEAVKIILDAVEQVGGIYLVTADHGNAEDMVKRNKSGKPLLDKSGDIQILTSHTLQPVPVAIGGPGLHPGVKFRTDIQTPGLANVAATVMNLHGFEAPADYEPSLIEVAEN